MTVVSRPHEVVCGFSIGLGLYDEMIRPVGTMTEYQMRELVTDDKPQDVGAIRPAVDRAQKAEGHGDRGASPAPAGEGAVVDGRSTAAIPISRQA